ncbi:MAG: hypothetical protein KDE51_03600 [Anaerolineales bacterium]|nr:hypothetical protein [Anaerolineales bacterium]
MQMVYNHSSYPLQPHHIDISNLNGVDHDIVQLCQHKGGWHSFTPQEIGWSKAELMMIKGLFQVGLKFFFTSDYIRRQFATSPAVNTHDFMKYMEAVKMLEKQPESLPDYQEASNTTAALTFLARPEMSSHRLRSYALSSV